MHRMTVQELRASLDGRPADELVTVYIEGWYYHATVITPDEQEDLMTTVIMPSMSSPYDSRFDHCIDDGDIEPCPYCGGELYDGDITLHIGRPYGPCPESQEEVLDVE